MTVLMNDCVENPPRSELRTPFSIMLSGPSVQYLRCTVYSTTVCCNARTVYDYNHVLVAVACTVIYCAF